MFGKVRVLVMNNLPGQHPVFDKVQQQVQYAASEQGNVFAQKAMKYVQFIDNPGTVKDPTPADRPEPDDFNNPKDIPGRYSIISHCCSHELPFKLVSVASDAQHSANLPGF